jgi:hypothetical protein
MQLSSYLRRPVAGDRRATVATAQRKNGHVLAIEHTV